ncbi:CLUMA_CG008092, isoform A [Clunio marinus]|uniref:CLUMA_CG008092, isoform A n=1 Tax=Clunio marinus TaxID=568069 RepID=A0A1J1I2L7_9DIPT|nr:CLUMA_CG008092, isoform A [Clunio marinus]
MPIQFVMCFHEWDHLRDSTMYFGRRFFIKNSYEKLTTEKRVFMSKLFMKMVFMSCEKERKL